MNKTAAESKAEALAKQLSEKDLKIREASLEVSRLKREIRMKDKMNAGSAHGESSTPKSHGKSDILGLGQVQSKGSRRFGHNDTEQSACTGGGTGFSKREADTRIFFIGATLPNLDATSE